ncbi:hypothetical protein [Nonomuraea insulae]|uniref:Uncharacterized protein n=1 Tax=Nonomuraea insulae TaxID=1616787 RepID=A0ABW1DB09_9ACTN
MATEDADHPVPAERQEDIAEREERPGNVEPAPAPRTPPRWRGHVKAPRAVKPSPATQKPAAPPAQPPEASGGEKTS